MLDEAFVGLIVSLFFSDCTDYSYKRKNMPDNKSLELLFILNPSSGGENKTDWKEKINKYFKNKHVSFKIYELPAGDNDKAELKKQLSDKPKKVIAVGGDGTVKMVAEELMHTETMLGILPAGSANGMAKELNIPDDAEKALNIILNGKEEKIDVLKINDNNTSIHLSDMGLNALLVIILIKKISAECGDM